MFNDDVASRAYLRDRSQLWSRGRAGRLDAIWTSGCSVTSKSSVFQPTAAASPGKLPHQMWHRFRSAVTMVTEQRAPWTGLAKEKNKEKNTLEYFDTFQSGALRANKEILTFCKTIWQDNKALLMYPRRQRYWIPCFCRHVLFHSGELNLTGKWKAAFCQVAARRGLQPAESIPLAFIWEICCSVTAANWQDWARKIPRAAHNQRAFSFLPVSDVR